MSDPTIHTHVYLGSQHDTHERRTWQVVILTVAMMLVEIVGGYVFNSMALTADGWHMSTHALALGLAGLAYRIARKHQDDARFSFGTGKFGELAAFGNALILLVVAVLIGFESLQRLLSPQTIHFREALPIAVAGLLVNLVSAWLLAGSDHGHDHGHGHAHDHHEHEHDHEHEEDTALHGHDTNLRAAYVHVMADALTSVLAIAALLAGYFEGIAWLDPLMGVLGAVIIIVWSRNLLGTASRVLLDVVPDARLARGIRQELENGGDRVTDFHLWRLGPEHLGLIASIASRDPQPPEHYKARLAHVDQLVHVTIEVTAAD